MLIPKPDSRLKTTNHHSGSLRYWWHDTNYVGAAHGASGIMLALLDAQALVPSALSPSHMGRVQATVEYIRTLRLSSGNYPSRPDQVIDWFKVELNATTLVHTGRTQ